MITPADIAFWTTVTVTAAECERYAAAAETRLNADGGYELAGDARIQLLSYLIAAMADNRTKGLRKHAESIGDYSYTAESSSATSGWYDVYQELLDRLIEQAALPSSDNGGITDHAADADIVRLNREYVRYGVR